MSIPFAFPILSAPIIDLSDWRHINETTPGMQDYNSVVLSVLNDGDIFTAVTKFILAVVGLVLAFVRPIVC